MVQWLLSIRDYCQISKSDQTKVHKGIAERQGHSQSINAHPEHRIEMKKDMHFMLVIRFNWKTLKKHVKNVAVVSQQTLKALISLCQSCDQSYLEISQKCAVRHNDPAIIPLQQRWNRVSFRQLQQTWTHEWIQNSNIRHDVSSVHFLCLMVE